MGKLNERIENGERWKGEEKRVEILDNCLYYSIV
jgi:hypothetical protein